MKTALLLLILLCLNITSLFAQHEADNWLFGEYSGMSFTSGAPVKISSGLNTTEGCAAVSEKTTGKLLFYTDGIRVWDGNNSIVANDLKGDPSGTQTALIVPNPADSTQYYIFTVPELTADIKDDEGLYYSLVSTKNQTVTVLIKNTLLYKGISEKLTGTLDCDESGFWVVTHGNGQNQFFSFHVTVQGVNPKPVISQYDALVTSHTVGYMKFSPNGLKLAVASYFGNSFLGLFDFNRSTGRVNNYIQLGNTSTTIAYYGASFSPDNTKLYASGFNHKDIIIDSSMIFQYQLDLATQTDILNSRFLVATRKIAPLASALQLGPDGKLYIASFNKKYVESIDNPNLKGSACNYRDSAVNLNSVCLAGLPNFMDYVFGNHCLSSSCELTTDTLTICRGSSVQIGRSPVPGITYSWSPAAGLDNPYISNPFASPDKTTEYNMKLRVNGCESYVTYYVKIAEKPIVPKVETICEGESVQLLVAAEGKLSWSPAKYLSDSTIANPIASPKTTTRYTLTVTNGLCVDSAFVIVNVTPKFIVNAGKDQIVCPNTSVQIGDTAKPGETYSWSPTDGLDNPILSNPIASPMATTRYYLTVTRDGCFGNASVLVSVANKITVSKDITICKGSSTQLVAGGGKVYSWYPQTRLSNPRIANPIASPLVTTKYRVIVTSGDCIDSAFVTVNVAPAFLVHAGTDKIVCPGSKTELGSAPENGITYSWFPTTYLDDPTKANPVCNPLKSTQYIVTATNTLGCIAKDTVMVFIKNLKVNAGADKTVCKGAKTQIGTVPEAGYSYQWQPSTYLDDGTKATPTVSPDSATQYILKVTNTEGCMGYDTVFVTIVNTLTAIATKDTAVCDGSGIQLLASGGSEYWWSPADGLDNANIENPIASPGSTTRYKVVVSSGACKDSASVLITVNPLPIANAGLDQSSCTGEKIQLGMSPQPGYSYTWQPQEGLDDPNIANPMASPGIETQYILTVTNSLGCSTFDTVVISGGLLSVNVCSDTSVCIGSSVQLTASGGNTYKWYPSIGLDNPDIPNPICTPNLKTTYKVIVSNGLCIDSAFVTVHALLTPIAFAGPDRFLCVGETTYLGVIPEFGETYKWQPIEGLDNPNISHPLASPKETTQYILTVNNETGCTSVDTVTVTVQPKQERIFSLKPSRVFITPGQPFQISLHTPSDIQSWRVQLGYDTLIVKFVSVVQSLNCLITDVPQQSNGKLTINGTGGDGQITMLFNAFLPHSSDTAFDVSLAFDTSSNQACTYITTTGNRIELNDYCGKSIRMIGSTGKKYYLVTKENGVSFGVGLSGRVRFELYDYTGTLKEVISDGTLEAGEYSIDFNLTTGVYFCRISAGMYEDVQKIMILQNR